MSKILLSEIAKQLLFEINENTTLYHRSFDKHSDGDILNPNAKFDDKSTHWLESKLQERKLEEYRQQHNPDAPSRFRCVYTSIVPNSAFASRGYLYEVKPIGNTHVTMAYLIDMMGYAFNEARYRNTRDRGWFTADDLGMSKDEYSEYIKKREAEDDTSAWYGSKRELENLFERYWSGKITAAEIKRNPKWVEVLCDKVQIVKAHGDETIKYLNKGTKAVITKNITAELTIYNVDKDPYIFKADGNNVEYNNNIINQIIKDFNGTKQTEGYETINYKLKIPAGTKGTITRARIQNPIPKDNAAGDAIYGNINDKNYSPYITLYFKPDDYDFAIDIYKQSQLQKFNVKDVIKKIS